ncbi:lysophospholipid acyltransferase family protein [Frankia sp. QA3]|uniref:lysophospholipid acyltransferase family protein n=1 Tax=Frankia sp. QA3 TaxID=710111 RepID=UPI000269BC4C|nr:lysophospholipid acyltransferase family protein [Frankia sp. QA3]EIV92198.1 1-acyl-sn-glycerol-3-phosphate acyltransferase [Frankia sp. QA3]
MGRPRRGVGLREAARGFRRGGPPWAPVGEAGRAARPAAREFPTGWARSGAARTTRAAFLRGVMNPLLHVSLTADAHGAEVFDTVRDTPVIIVSNHTSHLDAPLLLCSLPGWVRSRTAVTAAADYFFGSVWRGASSALAFATVPIDRSGGAPSSTPMDLLRDGWNLVIFPEGTRSRDGARGRFRLGAAYLAINAGVPVVPVGVRGAFAAMPRGRSWPVPGRPQVTVRFGRPLRPVPGEDVRTFTARLAAEVDRLCAEDATSWWDATRAALAEQPSDSPTPPAPGGRGGPPRQPTAADHADGDADGLFPAAGPALAGPALGGPRLRGGDDGANGSPSAGGAAPTAAVGEARTLGRHRPRAAARSGTGPVSISARLRGAPGTPTARWRRIWAATEPLPRSTSRSPWRR